MRGLDNAKKVAEIIKILVPNILLIVLSILLFGPISKLVSIIPEKIREADKFSADATGLTWEIQETAKARGHPELAVHLGGLSEDAVRYLLSWDENGKERRIIGYYVDGKGTYVFDVPSDKRIVSYKQLEDKGLLECNTNIEKWRSLIENYLTIYNDSDHSDGMTMKLKPNSKETFPSVRGRVENRCSITKYGKSAIKIVIDVVSKEISAGSVSKNLD